MSSARSVQLDTDVLRLLFSYLSVPDRKSARLVCREWYAVSRGRTLRDQEVVKIDSYQRLYDATQPKDAPELREAFYLNDLRGVVEDCACIPVRHLVVSDCNVALDSSVEQDFGKSQARNIHSIVFKEACTIPSLSVLTILKHCTSLQSLSFLEDSFQTLKSTPFSVHLPHLTSLSFHECIQLTDNDLQLFAASAPNIREFSLKCVRLCDQEMYPRKMKAILARREVSYQGVQTFVGRLSKTLKHLEVEESITFNFEQYEKLLKTEGLQLESIAILSSSHPYPNKRPVELLQLRALEAQKNNLREIRSICLHHMTFASVLAHFASYPHLRSVHFYTVPEWLIGTPFNDGILSDYCWDDEGDRRDTQILKCRMVLSTDAKLISTGGHVGGCDCRRRIPRLSDAPSTAGDAASAAAAAAPAPIQFQLSNAAVCRFQRLEISQMASWFAQGFQRHRDLQLLSPYQLTALELRYCRSLTDDTMNAVCRWLTNLRTLVINCRTLTDAALTGVHHSSGKNGVTVASTSGCANLGTAVGLSGGVGADAAVSTAGDTSSEVTAGPSGATKVVAEAGSSGGTNAGAAAALGCTNAEAPAAICNLHRLVDLRLIHIENITDTGVAALRFFNLRVLFLQQNTHFDVPTPGPKNTAITDASFRFPGAQISPSLETLAIDGCTALTDAAVAGIVRLHPRLRRLELTEVPLLSDASLRSVSEHCPDIRSLSVDYPWSKVTAAGIRAFNGRTHKRTSGKIIDV